MFTYEDLIRFVEKNNYQKLPFDTVINLYKMEIDEYYESINADTYIMEEKDTGMF